MTNTEWDTMTKDQRDRCCEYQHNRCCESQRLSEKFIVARWKKMTENQRNLCYKFQRLSEKFVAARWDALTEWQRNLCYECQCLSEKFIQVHWDEMTEYQRNPCCERQRLSEEFVAARWDALTEWQRDLCCECQRLSEKFVAARWDTLTEYQRGRCCSFQCLSEKFVAARWDALTEWQRELYVSVQRNYPDTAECERRAREYAKKHNLRVERGRFYAYRNHDQHGRGQFNKTFFYKPGCEYRDWHCDPRKDQGNSFGLGIWPRGNASVSVKLEDFVVEPEPRRDGKARVQAFRVEEKEPAYPVWTTWPISGRMQTVPNPLRGGRKHR